MHDDEITSDELDDALDTAETLRVDPHTALRPRIARGAPLADDTA